MTLGIPRKHMSGDSYQLAPFDYHSLVVAGDFKNLL